CALEASVSYWIYKVVRLNIRKLDLEGHLFQLPLSMFTCKTLTTLILIQSPHDGNDDWEIHFPVNLPCLKTLDITVYANLVPSAFKLINGCPVLESLSLKLLNGLSGVKSLSLQNMTSLMEFRSPISLRLPIFPNMTHLELTWFWHTRLIPQFLERAPELKHLFIEKLVDAFRKEPEEYSWVDPKLVPVCML
ncbi:hypothetical protein M8C21_027814, partial [Ambrosia artemisiifolia]